MGELKKYYTPTRDNRDIQITAIDAPQSIKNTPITESIKLYIKHAREVYNNPNIIPDLIDIQTYITTANNAMESYISARMGEIDNYDVKIFNTTRSKQEIITFINDPVTNHIKRFDDLYPREH